jgi:hypothetical protein
MHNSIVKIFCQILKKYAYILQRDLQEVTHVTPSKRINFLNNGIKIFFKNIEEETKLFNLEFDYDYNTGTSEYFLDTVLCIQIQNEQIKENIIFNPLKLHIFFSDNQSIYFNDKKIILGQNTNNVQIRSINPLFIQNLYICYFLLGCFKELIIYEQHLENNKYALAICNNLSHILIQKITEGIILKKNL